MPNSLPLQTEAAVPQDVGELSELYADVFRVTYPNVTADISQAWCNAKADAFTRSPSIDYRRERLEYAQTNPEKFWQIVRLAGRIVGEIEGHQAADTGFQQLQHIAVDPELHGKGIAPVLMDAFLAWVDPAQPIELLVADYNHRAIAFYHKYGFARVPDVPIIQPMGIPCITMRREAQEDR